MANAFDRLMLSIKPYLPGVLDDALKTELFLVMYEFFKWSDAWQEPVDFTVLGGQNTADIYPFMGRIQKMIQVLDTDKRNVPATMPVIPTVVLRSPVNTDTDLTCVVSLTVTDPTTRDAFPLVPFELIEKHLDVLIAGMLSHMMAQPSKPYTNTQMAQYHYMKFKGGCARAKNDIKAENTQGAQSWAFPQTFANR